jgi:hypothetical protein
MEAFHDHSPLMIVDINKLTRPHPKHNADRLQLWHCHQRQLLQWLVLVGWLRVQNGSLNRSFFYGVLAREK